MIGRLRGIVAYKAPPWLVVDVNGVGYELEAPMSTFYDLPELGREVTLYTHYSQKEDSVSLYGFLREGERRLFRDVYVERAVPDTHRLRARAAASLLVPGAVVTGASAASRMSTVSTKPASTALWLRE